MKRSRSLRAAAVLLGAAAVGLGSLAALRALHVLPTAPEQIDAVPNPLPATPQTLALGERVYRAQCEECHGPDGQGNGPQAAGLFPPPTNFVAHFGSGHVHPDGRLYYWTVRGIPGTGMPAFGGRLFEQERWAVVTYLRRAFTPAER